MGQLKIRSCYSKRKDEIRREGLNFMALEQSYFSNFAVLSLGDTAGQVPQYIVSRCESVEMRPGFGDEARMIYSSSSSPAATASSSSFSSAAGVSVTFVLAFSVRSPFCSSASSSSPPASSSNSSSGSSSGSSPSSNSSSSPLAAGASSSVAGAVLAFFAGGALSIW